MAPSKSILVILVLLACSLIEPLMGCSRNDRGQLPEYPTFIVVFFLDAQAPSIFHYNGQEYKKCMVLKSPVNYSFSADLSPDLYEFSEDRTYTLMILGREVQFLSSPTSGSFTYTIASESGTVDNKRIKIEIVGIWRGISDTEQIQTMRSAEAIIQGLFRGAMD